MDSTTLKPITSIGVFADVQYADVEDGFNFTKTKKRCFRKAGDVCLKEIIETFDNYSQKLAFENYKPANALSPRELEKITINKGQQISESPSDRPEITTILQLGDLTDGRCKKKAREENDRTVPFKAVEKLLSYINSSKFIQQKLHCMGNHEFYNFTRSQLNDYFYKSDQSGFEFNLFADTFAFVQPVKSNPRIKVVHLDSYDISDSGRTRGSQKQKLAEEILRKENPENFALRNTNSKTGLTGDQQRFVAYTGGLSDEQLEWVEKTLSSLDEDPETDLVLMMSHCNIHPKALIGYNHEARSNTLWNFEEIFKIINRVNKKSKILTHFAGHHHGGGYYFDQGKKYHDDKSSDPVLVEIEENVNRNIHHITMGGIIEKTDTNHFGILEFYERFAVLWGYGDCKSRVLKYHDDVRLRGGDEA